MPDLRWLAVTPTPTPTAPPPESVTPGIAGFIGIAVVAVVVVLLALDMLRRIRRAQYRVDVNEQLDEEERAGREGDGPGKSGPDDGAAGDLSPGSPTRG
ncbi:hypothetical protein KZX37_10275 [Microbacterium sp. EYE_5]|uniref:hypothetical protein n=1 Tax=unclassified Microbacterium TaxID=2609290 RepID=UPI002004977C|nr:MULTISPECIES: hypothetical protein [unclassified Microbacterium]MCK6081099.1 hypothetical protein [Microbacterium sp. EYE_382]MCK6086369.1 hypothetical protein [Microbacterium sp. EYE_384]MCK6124133.1 hypothetical protein [Microbacterium sp. EYE_80]MCK6127042.1 hypothetical protein [Microbacterium sp. EYE_79]MCK6142054.1 hypothetical protein [Microbacterium sp. EYE_39]